MNIYMQVNVNIFKIYPVCVCISIYIINMHSSHTHILHQNQNELYWQVCLHMQGICFRDIKVPQCNRITETEQKHR